MTYDDLAVRNKAGNTAFCLAAASGKVELAKVMMKENGGGNAYLAMTRGRNNELPLYMAASQGHRKMARYLYMLTTKELTDEEYNDFLEKDYNDSLAEQEANERDGITTTKINPRILREEVVRRWRNRDNPDLRVRHLLEKEYNDNKEIFVTLIHAGIYDVALTMIEEDKTLAIARNRHQETALHVLAQKSSLCANISRPNQLGIWNRCIDFFSKISQKNCNMHEKAVRLVKIIWDEIAKKDDKEISRLIESPWSLIFVAAEKGNVEFLSILIRSYPDLIFKVDVNRYTIFHIAVKHRQEEIFKLIHEFGSIKDLITTYKDDESNNMLHLAAKLPFTASRLHVVPGAALQLQRELIWFEEVKEVVQVLPLLEARNKDELTPEVLFIKSHEKLMKQGEEWMRGTADKCMLVAALIATVVFAAAFTVPGGNGQDDGIPIFLRRIAFKFFAAADAVSLISSVASVLSFLGIMTSRYQLYDFYSWLPSKLIIGLATLFISIVAMLVVFAAALFLVLDHGYGLIWFAVPIAVLASVPVLLFVSMHSRLIKDMIKQTYMSKSIFKPNKQPLSLEPQVAETIVDVKKSD